MKPKVDPQQTQEACPSEITPLPWHVGPHYKTDIYSLHGYVGQTQPMMSPRAEANARYIVEACNAYPALAEQLERLRRVTLEWGVSSHLEVQRCLSSYLAILWPDSPPPDPTPTEHLQAQLASAEAARDQLQRELDSEREDRRTSELWTKSYQAGDAQTITELRAEVDRLQRQRDWLRDRLQVVVNCWAEEPTIAAHIWLDILRDIRRGLADIPKSAESSLSQIRQALQNLVDVARPSFPKTPFREALDAAKALLHASEGRQERKRDV